MHETMKLIYLGMSYVYIFNIYASIISRKILFSFGRYYIMKYKIRGWDLKEKLLVSINK